ncbi:amino acid carrier protein [Fulvivirgaceae bacterium BMA10]|uniref:Amino acid carrier protein n=1 Tax=Splendidivirga corallicola TaxID=3051826 RepID=A0ABT8KX46_9BACT|nr:amino acid carrier protein [Fulvivirgaceae bacterium BMA10]
MQRLNEILQTIDGYLGGGQWFVFLLLGVGVFFTLYLKFPQIRFLGHAFKVVRGKFDKEGDEGDTSHFQALATALSGTVGTGNIGGVAFAIYLGGPAALFWMLVTAFLGMTTKFVEVTLSHKYREKAEDGSIAGGPMYYMKNKLNAKWLAAIFAGATVLSSFGTGNMPQVNNIASSVFATFGIAQWITGAVLGVLLMFVIVGGIKRIAKVTEKLVPSMAVLYFIGAFSVILYNYENIVPSIMAIFGDIFSGSAATGGFLGATIAYAFNRGVNRGLFSNEAGQGSAPIAHAAAKAHEPVSEGMVAILEPFIDTIIICTITGLTLLSSGVWSEKHQNEFDYAELQVLAQYYDEGNEQHRSQIGSHLVGKEALPLYNGDLQVENGEVQDELTIIHMRSFAEDMVINKDGTPYTGSIAVENGSFVDDSYIINGKSLVHSAELTTIAFTRGFFGDFGKYIVSIGLLLFAFSTAISWSYYGDRAMTYLAGSKSVLYYRLVYVGAFFFASFADTAIVWTMANIAIVLMTVPNLVGILMLSGDMRDTLKKYWVDFRKEWPDSK